MSHCERESHCYNALQSLSQMQKRGVLCDILLQVVPGTTTTVDTAQVIPQTDSHSDESTVTDKANVTAQQPHVSIHTIADQHRHVDIHTSGAEMPDVNIHKSSAQRPCVNVETSSAKQPDVNINTSSTEVPDVSIGKSNAELLDVNIHTSVGHPNVSIHTSSAYAPSGGTAASHANTDGCIAESRDECTSTTLICNPDLSCMYAHKAVLAACSNYLCSLLISKPDIKMIPVTTFTMDTLKAVIGYMYTGELSLTPDNVDAILAACQHWRIQDAVGICTRYKLVSAITLQDDGVVIEKTVHKKSKTESRVDAKQEHKALPPLITAALKEDVHESQTKTSNTAHLYGLRPKKRKRYGQVSKACAKMTATHRKSRANVMLENVSIIQPQNNNGRGKHANLLDLSIFDEDTNTESKLSDKELDGVSEADCDMEKDAAQDEDREDAEVSATDNGANDIKTKDTKPTSNASSSTKAHQCQKCSLHFRTWLQLKRHSNTCHIKSSRVAVKNEEASNGANKVVSWRRPHKPFTCSQCPFRCQVESRLVEHLYRRHGIPLENSTFEVYVCESAGCGYKSILRNVMKHHQKKHSEERPYMCEICGSKFKSKVTLRTHSHIHSNHRAFKCQYCDAAYIQRVGLVNHIKCKHENSNEFLCSQCPYVTSLKGNLQNHMFTAHNVLQNSRTKVYECEHCGLKTLRKSEYTNHMQRHSGIRNYICEICNHKFFTIAEVNNHRKRHLDNVPKHKCPYEDCTFSVFEKSKLTQHIQIRHTQKGAKPWTCYVCQYRTDLKGNLTKHLRTVHRLKVATNQRLCKVVADNVQTPPTDGVMVNVNDLYVSKAPGECPVMPTVYSSVTQPMEMSANKDCTPLRTASVLQHALMLPANESTTTVDASNMALVGDVTTAMEQAPPRPAEIAIPHTMVTELQPPRPPTQMAIAHTMVTELQPLAPPPVDSAIPHTMVTELQPAARQAEMAIPHTMVTELQPASMTANTSMPSPVSTLTPLVSHLSPLTPAQGNFQDAQLAQIPVLPTMFTGTEANLYMYAGDGQIIPAQSIPWEHTYDMSQFRQPYK